MSKRLPAEALPLYWPEGWPRTPALKRRRAVFKTSLGSAIADLAREVNLLAAGGAMVVSSNLRTRRDGLPYASEPEPDDPGVAVYWFDARSKEQRVIACDRWDRVRDNMHALELSIAALRGLSRWGASEIVSRAFTGFKALPAGAAPPAPTVRPWRDVLGMPPTDGLEAPIVLDIARGIHRRLAQSYHPDRGGSTAAMAELNAALDAAETELR